MSTQGLTSTNTSKSSGSRNGSLVISEHPEIFGKMSEEFQKIKNKDHHELIQKAVLGLAVAVLIPILFIAFRIYVEFSGDGNGRWLLDSVKILFIYGAIIAIVAMIAIPFAYKALRDLLIDVEEVALFGRDFALFNLPIYRQQLCDLREKLKGTDKEEVMTGLDVIKDLAPLVKMFMAKDKSLFKWGMSGFKMFKKLKSFIEGK